MNDYKYHYIFTTFDIETFDLEDFKYNFVNMTAFRVVDGDQVFVKEVLRDMAKFQANQELTLINSSYIQVSLFDLFSRSIPDQWKNNKIKIPCGCNYSFPRIYGPHLLHSKCIETGNKNWHARKFRKFLDATIQNEECIPSWETSNSYDEVFNAFARVRDAIFNAVIN